MCACESPAELACGVSVCVAGAPDSAGARPMAGGHYVWGSRWLIDRSASAWATGHRSRTPSVQAVTRMDANVACDPATLRRGRAAPSAEPPPQRCSASRISGLPHSPVPTAAPWAENNQREGSFSVTRAAREGGGRGGGRTRAGGGREYRRRSAYHGGDARDAAG